MSPTCPKIAKFVNIDRYKTFIVNFHNQKRNQVAGGNLPGFKSAVRMATIQWDNDLAYLAGLNVKKCKYGIDQCINTNQYQYSGQNVGKSSWYGYKRTDLDLIENQLNGWFNNYILATMSDIDKVPSTSDASLTFTVMVAQLSTRVGCASVRSLELKNGTYWETFTTACNYAHANIVGCKIYVSGPAASKCTTGNNKDYVNLCSINEVYNVNVCAK